VERARELFPGAVMAVKAVLRAHQLAGFPGVKHLKRASRFRAWDQRVRAAIVWLGYADPIITQDSIRSDDPVRNESLRLLWMLREKFRETPFLTGNLSSLTAESIEVLKQVTGHKEGEALNKRKVGKYFSHYLAGRWFEGIRLVRTGKNPGGRVEWRIEAKPDAASFGVEEEAL
jgi:putative DNA primase/helicase